MTIDEIYIMITEAYISDPEVIAQYGLVEGKTFDEQFSAVSIERIVFYNVATAMFVNYQSQDQHTVVIDTKLREEKAHTPNWYAMKALQFQYGCELYGDTDYYDNSRLTVDQIEASRIVKFAAAVDSDTKSITYLKIARDTNGQKQPLTTDQLIAFKTYISRIQDCGVNIVVINDTADQIRIEMDIYYNPLVLDKDGKRLDGTDGTPIQNAIRHYVQNLSFNGVYANVKLVDAVQSVDGVVLPQLKRASSKYGVYTDYTDIEAMEKAHAGYYSIPDSNMTLRFIPYEQLL